jgi:hypothetical protein
LGLAAGSDSVAPPIRYDGFDMDRAITALDQNASKNQAATGWCAQYLRQALEAGGFDTRGHPESAYGYGDFLTKRGAVPVASSPDASTPQNYTPQAGDIAVFANGNGHDNGHVQMYDGNGWVSDWHQQAPYSPFRKPETTTPSIVYRLPGQ